MLATDVDRGGGVARQSFTLLRALGERGVCTFLLARNYSRKARFETRDGTIVRRSPVFGRLYVLNSIIYLIDALIWLVWNRARYDVVHCQQMSGPAMAALVAKYLTRKPVLVRVTSCGVEGEIREVATMPLAALRRRELENVDCWVALTHEMKRELLEFGIPAARIAVIPNGTVIPPATVAISAKRSAARQQLGLCGASVVVYSGRLSAEKGVDVLLRAWSDVASVHTSARLLILGAGGDYRNVERELRELHRELGLTSATFCGHVTNVADYLMAADAFVLPSRTEGMSNALVEAMAAGVPVVASDIPANRELIIQRETGLLFRTGDELALAMALRELLAAPEWARGLGSAARAFAERELSTDAMSARYVREYNRLLRAR